MKVMRKNLKIATAVVFMAITMSACGRPNLHMGGGVPVAAVDLRTTPVSIASVYQGKLISRYSVSLQPQVSGQVSSIYVKAGDHVRAGQLLMIIDKRKQEATLNSTRAEANVSKASIAQAQDMLQNYQVQREALLSSYNFNKQLYNRYKALYEKKSVSQQDYEKYTDSYNKAKADLDANAAQIKAQKSAILAAKSTYQRSLANVSEQATQLQYYKIVAPYSGVVGDIPVKVGSYVTSTTQLLSVTQNDNLELNVGLPVDKVFDIKAGLPVEILDNNDKVVANSTISFVSPRIDTDTQTILVKSIIKNTLGILKSDQSVKVRVVYDKAPGILVPTSAIQHFGGQDFAYVITQKGNASFVKQQPVKLGEVQNDSYSVIQGLKEGDKIVAEGIQKLGDGAPVTILGGNK